MYITWDNSYLPFIYLHLENRHLVTFQGQALYDGDTFLLVVGRKEYPMCFTYWIGKNGSRKITRGESGGGVLTLGRPSNILAQWIKCIWFVLSFIINLYLAYFNYAVLFMWSAEPQRGMKEISKKNWALSKTRLRHYRMPCKTKLQMVVSPSGLSIMKRTMQGISDTWLI